jgi:hypothetical protein
MRRCCTCDAVDQRMITTKKNFIKASPLLPGCDPTNLSPQKKFKAPGNQLTTVHHQSFVCPSELALRREVLKAAKIETINIPAVTEPVDSPPFFVVIHRLSAVLLWVVPAAATAPFSLSFHLKLSRAVLQQSSATPSSARTSSLFEGTSSLLHLQRLFIRCPNVLLCAGR